MRGFLSCVLGSFLALAMTCSWATEATPIRLQLDWRFEGPSAFFLLPKGKGYFKEAGLDVSVDVGNGSGGAVQRVAIGAYDIGFADMSSLMEFYANNPTVPNKPVAVMAIYNNMPGAVLTLRKSGISKPADLVGKKIGAPIFDASRRAFPIFAKANRINNVDWITMDPPLRETMLLRGDVDAIVGFSTTSLLNLEARGAKESDIVVMPYPNYGVKLYGNVIIASSKLVKEHPEALKAFLKAFARGAKDVLADPEHAVAYVKQRDGIIDTQLETRRLKMVIDVAVDTKEARAEGFGKVRADRLVLMTSQVSEAFGLGSRIDLKKVWNGDFLPTGTDSDVFPTR